MKIGENLLELRKKSGLSREDVGKQIGKTGKTVGNYENNINYPDVEILHRLAKLYNVTISQLLGENTDEINKKEATAKKLESENAIVPVFENVLRALNSDGSLYNKNFDSLDETKKKIIIEVINDCINNLEKKD